MIIDEKFIITGSFNFTKAAQYKNAENLLIIYDSVLAEKYKLNWQARQLASSTLEAYNSTYNYKSKKNHYF